jgi:hypothetical protein
VVHGRPGGSDALKGEPTAVADAAAVNTKHLLFIHQLFK